MLNCGHLIHSECFDSYFKTKIYCPVCKKFPFDEEVKQEFANSIQREMDNTVMSDELASIQVSIICNDCLVKSTTNFNIVALKCKD
mmetsp:Transcript_5164/g.6096  ORF Transcript_5164/g.6096 Transcript_5164/m.6096 type:complete len:86 (+) Transcript_5164:501-758(+)